MKKVLGLGNALTDILLQIEDDSILSQIGFPKGSMQLIDEQKVLEISGVFSGYSKKMAAGGSSANTICGITKLGGEAGFVGKIGKDQVGEFFSRDLVKNGVLPQMLRSANPSGSCTVLVSPDGERTMCTFLGAASELLASELNVEMFKGYDIFHIEGYLVFNQELIRRAVQLAKEAGLTISIDMASYNVVEANLDFLGEIVSEYVDIVFANEEEARAFTGLEPLEALYKISEQCAISVVKVGKDGSYIKSGDQVIRIQPHTVNCIDTTGAGDLYAAGFLFGLSNDYSLEKCGNLGSFVSAKVVEVLGAKMPENVWSDIHISISRF
jgi:sugar/nucleoside kinase (ribokinase family)